MKKILYQDKLKKLKYFNILAILHNGKLSLMKSYKKYDKTKYIIIILFK